MKRRLGSAVPFLISLLVVSAAALPHVVRAAGQAGKPAYTPPRGLQALPITTPPDNALTAGRIALGKQLFFDVRLSRTKKMSCETCHVP